MINLLSSATSLPPHQISTKKLISSLGHKLSPELIKMINALGVEHRYSTLENYPAFLAGEDMRPTTSATNLGVNAALRAIQMWNGDPGRIGLLIAATNTPAQLLPCLASEMMANMHDTLSRSINTVSMQAQGCSVLLKAVEVARWYLLGNPNKIALVIMSEAHTPYIRPLIKPMLGEVYFGYRELARMRRNYPLEEVERMRTDTTFVVQAMLFGDGAVALLLGREDGLASFGPIAHLTNDEPEDVNLLAMEGGSLQPCTNGRPQYLMRPNVPHRGAHYALSTVKSVFNHPQSSVHSIGDVERCLIHTGSKKILDGVCAQLELAPESSKVRLSYEILKNYGNLSCASTGFMLTENSFQKGSALVVGFGVGFAASAGVVHFS
jgi:3-oxoacyl-[acyl-carrier-protein] synthase-3